MLEQARDVVVRELSRGESHLAEWGYVSTKVKDTMTRYFYDQTKRRPMVLPVLVEV